MPSLFSDEERRKKRKGDGRNGREKRQGGGDVYERERKRKEQKMKELKTNGLTKIEPFSLFIFQEITTTLIPSSGSTSATFSHLLNPAF
jgi:hypothetical protein